MTSPDSGSPTSSPQFQSSLEMLRAKGAWQEGTPLRLHLGCGETLLQGYVNIDYPSSEHNVMTIKPDVATDILTLDFPPESVDEIRLEHVFEHFSRVTALAMLIRWQKWLKVGGMIHIVTPDLQGCAENILAAPSFDIKMGNIRHLAGDQAAAWAYHIDHWFPERFQVTLTHLGFDAIEAVSDKWPHAPFLANVTVRARKDASIPLPDLITRAEDLLRHSMVGASEQPTFEVWCRQLRELLTEKAPAPAPRNTTTVALENVLTAARTFKFGDQETAYPEIHDFNQLSRDRWVAAKAAQLTSGTSILDVGAGTCPYRNLFAHCQYKTHDFKQYTGEKLGGTREYGAIDYVSDITSIPVPDASFDAILCTEVLEHVPEPIEAVREMARIVRPGGKIFITAPLGSGLHQKPFHYYGGYTPFWYATVAERFGLNVNEVKANHGLLAHFAQMSIRSARLIPKHPAIPVEAVKYVEDFFAHTLPRLCFEMDKDLLDEDFTVGYFVEYTKPLC